MEVHFCSAATGKEMKYLRKFAKNTQTFSVITLLISLYLMNKYLFLANLFTSCDTSAIDNFGKTSIFKKLKDSAALTNIGDIFYKEFKTPEEIGNACIHFFEKMYSPYDQLPQTSKRWYDKMVRTDRARIDSSLLPQSPRPAYYHGFHVYHQIKVWKAQSEI